MEDDREFKSWFNSLYVPYLTMIKSTKDKSRFVIRYEVSDRA